MSGVKAGVKNEAFGATLTIDCKSRKHWPGSLATNVVPIGKNVRFQDAFHISYIVLIPRVSKWRERKCLVAAQAPISSSKTFASS